MNIAYFVVICTLSSYSSPSIRICLVAIPSNPLTSITAKSDLGRPARSVCGVPTFSIQNSKVITPSGANTTDAALLSMVTELYSPSPNLASIKYVMLFLIARMVNCALLSGKPSSFSSALVECSKLVTSMMMSLLL